MELKELTDRTLELFQVDSTEYLKDSIMEHINDVSICDKFLRFVEDLSIDWLQMIFQYYQADRKEKMQDYTPKNLALLMGMLAGESEIVIDLCAGTGALTIQKWNQNHDQRFVLYEMDENVIPYLLFNLALRNIEADVYRADVLQMELFNFYKVRRGERFGVVEEVAGHECFNI